jgi:hypothetical protein
LPPLNRRSFLGGARSRRSVEISAAANHCCCASGHCVGLSGKGIAHATLYNASLHQILMLEIS